MIYQLKTINVVFLIYIYIYINIIFSYAKLILLKRIEFYCNKKKHYYLFDLLCIYTGDKKVIF